MTRLLRRALAAIGGALRRVLAAIGALPAAIGALPATIGALPATIGPLPAAIGALPAAPPPLLVMPRDAGFFSTLNYLVGVLVEQELDERAAGRVPARVYPVWNRRAWRAAWGHPPRDFAYLDDAPDAWTHFFEPLDGGQAAAVAAAVAATAAATNATTAANAAASSDLRYVVAPRGRDEFKQPAAVARLMADDRFGAWRREVHAVAARRLRPSRAVRDALWASAGAEDLMRRAIGVHYRSPAHCREQGALVLADYFAVVDALTSRAVAAGGAQPPIFLATDTELGVLAFWARYGARVRYAADNERCSLDDLLRWAYSGSPTDDGALGADCVAQVHQRAARAEDACCDPRLGVQALVDALCLARCAHLVHAQSNLALAVAYLNPDLPLHHVTGHAWRGLRRPRA